MVEWKEITTEIRSSNKAYLVYDEKEYYPPMVARFITGHGWVPISYSSLVWWSPTRYMEIPDTKELKKNMKITYADVFRGNNTNDRVRIETDSNGAKIYLGNNFPKEDKYVMLHPAQVESLWKGVQGE